jgi:hypothetical protein
VYPFGRAPAGRGGRLVFWSASFVHLLLVNAIAWRQDNGWKRHQLPAIKEMARFEHGCPSFRNPFGFRIPFSCPAAAGELRSAGKLNRQDSPGFRPLTVVASITIFLRHPGHWLDSPLGVHPLPSSAEFLRSLC